MQVDKFKDLTEDQVNIFAFLTNIQMKVRVTNCILVAFFILLALLILLVSNVIKSSWQDKTILGAVEGILTYTMYPLVKHYLPAIKNARAAEKRAKKKTSP